MRRFSNKTLRGGKSHHQKVTLPMSIFLAAACLLLIFSQPATSSCSSVVACSKGAPKSNQAPNVSKTKISLSISYHPYQRNDLIFTQSDIFNTCFYLNCYH